ncbi:glycosyltransferase family 4 protein [Parabacteroides pacaensis]|uniref:glycosyltransferase family 4 protein n=1 Tax=Parabacteroides pacaensis TaxID=2086575 RepID=UPI000D110F02|nr:glycosyltransferase family 4 protein [Parabacteroides pacaensis]
MKQLLFIRYRKPGKIEEGGEQVTHTNYNILCRLLGKENISTYYVHEKLGKKKIIKHAFSILFYFLKGYYYGLSPRKVQEIVEMAQEYSYVFIDRSIFGIIAQALKVNGYPGKIITFFHNVETIYFAAKINKYMPWRSIVVSCADKNDALSCQYSDRIIALTQRDGKEILQRYKRTPDLFTPVVFKDKYIKETYPTEMTDSIPTCLFLGTYFPMNVQGIMWFIQEVLPHVHIRLQIVGKGMKALETKLGNNKNIEIYSDVPDLQPYIEQADFMLLPLFQGSGMKIKTCESLMYGKNILGTSETFEGYNLDFNRVGALCNTKEEFIHAINHFSRYPVPRFNTYSRQIFLDNHSEEIKTEQFKKIFFR